MDQAETIQLFHRVLHLGTARENPGEILAELYRDDFVCHGRCMGTHSGLVPIERCIFGPERAELREIMFVVGSVECGDYRIVGTFSGSCSLAAFMVEQRTREIGIRKVMGANLIQIIRLLIWQFSKPVLWASLAALPAAYFASNFYLDFFADRLPLPGFIVAVAGLIGIVLSWVIVGIHVIRIAKANPIKALRYE